MEMIQSGSNPRIKELVKLRESPRKRRERNAFVVEGADDLERFIRSNRQVMEIFYCPELISQKDSNALLQCWEKETVNVQPLGINAFQKASYRNNSDGVLGVIRAWNLELNPEFKSQTDLILVLDEVE